MYSLDEWQHSLHVTYTTSSRGDGILPSPLKILKAKKQPKNVFTDKINAEYQHTGTLSLIFGARKCFLPLGSSWPHHCVGTCMSSHYVSGVDTYISCICSHLYLHW